MRYSIASLALLTGLTLPTEESFANTFETGNTPTVNTTDTNETLETARAEYLQKVRINLVKDIEAQLGRRPGNPSEPTQELQRIWDAYAQACIEGNLDIVNGILSMVNARTPDGERQPVTAAWECREYTYTPEPIPFTSTPSPISATSTFHKGVDTTFTWELSLENPHLRIPAHKETTINLPNNP
jgi:hypothetical protein